MNRFLETTPVVLTPLTPIHVGCGQDFEPTNYVIDNGVLYHFDPARLPMNERDYKELIQSVSKPADEAIREVQRFFHGRRVQCREASRLEVPVAAGVAQRYDERIGQVGQRETTGRAVINELAIERTAHHPHSGAPYLPGSGLKGAMRTGWLNQLDQGPSVQRNRDRPPSEKSSEVEAELLGGTFHADPFRLVDVADASGAQVQSAICFAINRRKPSLPERAGRPPRQKNLAACCEVISAGQFRELRSEVRFERPPPSARPAQAHRITDFFALARACNSFYLDNLKLELQTLESLAGRPWLEAFRVMIQSITPSLNGGRVMLLRVGRHSGAESVTLKRRRWIQIREGRGRSHWADEPTTIWFAAEREASTSGMRPFGWLLVEPGEPGPQDALHRWCDSEMNRSSRQSQPGTGSPQFRFRKGDRVTDGDQEGVVVSDVRSADTRMEVDFGGSEIEPVPVANWKKA
jgi:CRISPR-associated protein Csm5